MKDAMTNPWRIAPIWTSVAVSAAVVGTATSLAIPALVGRTITAFAQGRESAQLIWLLIAAVAATVTMGVLAAVAGGSGSALITAGIRRALSRSIVRTEGPGVDGVRFGTSDLITRLLLDSSALSRAVPIAVSLILSCASLLVGMVMLLLIDWWLLVGVVAGLLLLTAMLRRYIDDTAGPISTYRESQAEIGQRLLDAQRGSASIRAYGTWMRELARIVRPLPVLRAVGSRLWAAQGRMAWRSSIFVPSIQLSMVGLGCVSMAAGRISVGQLVTALAYSTVILGALDGVEAAAGLNLVKAGRSRIVEVVGSWTPGRVTGSPPSTDEPLEVVLDSVTVLGADGGPILDDISLTIPAGALVAVTGPAGSGRSTFAGMVAGTIVPASGNVLIGGVPLVQIPAAARAGLVVLGSSRPALIGETVAGLIGLGLGPLTADVVAQNARDAHIADVIDALPGGYLARLDELQLSGGELQRLGIAQAMARNSKVMVLDDATSNLDAATEREVVGALRAAGRGCTCILVTNRPAVARLADVVIRLEAGHVVSSTTLSSSTAPSSTMASMR